MNSEMILYIKSAFAQGEAMSASKRMKTSVRMKMEDGTYVSSSAPFGYKLVPVYTDHVVKAFGNVDENDLMTVSFISDVVDAILVNKEGEAIIRFVNDTEVGIAEVKLCMNRHNQRKRL